MAQGTFGSILDKAPSEVERPKPLPAGTYVAMVKGLPRFDKSTKKGTEFVEFTMQLIEPYKNEDGESDVDQDDLAASLTKPSGDVVPLNERTMRNTYYLTEDALWRLKKFLVDDLGIEEGESFRSMIDETPGKQCLISLKHTASDDGTAVFANVANTAPVAA